MGKQAISRYTETINYNIDAENFRKPIFILVEIAMEVIISLFMAELIDERITSGQMNQLRNRGKPPNPQLTLSI